jgi:hypothetical protein
MTKKKRMQTKNMVTISSQDVPVAAFSMFVGKGLEDIENSLKFYRYLLLKIRERFPHTV